MKALSLVRVFLFLLSIGQVLLWSTKAPKLNVYSINLSNNQRFAKLPKPKYFNAKPVKSYTIRTIKQGDQDSQRVISEVKPNALSERRLRRLETEDDSSTDSGNATKTTPSMNMNIPMPMPSIPMSAPSVSVPMPMPPPNIHGDSLVMPTSAPQIEAPRLIIRNFPKPTNVDYLSNRNLSQDPNQTGVNFVPHPIIQQAGSLWNDWDPTEDKKSRKLQQVHSRKSLLHKLKNKKSRKPTARKLRGVKSHKRNLMVRPYIEAGPGYMDFGTHGYSPLSYALFHHNADQLTSFVPRSGPPPPIRIEIQDHALSIPTPTNFSPSQREMENVDLQHMENQLAMEVKSFNVDISLFRQNFDSIYNRVRAAVEKSLSNTQSKNLKGEEILTNFQQRTSKKIEEMQAKSEAIAKALREKIEHDKTSQSENSNGLQQENNFPLGKKQPPKDQRMI